MQGLRESAPLEGHRVRTPPEAVPAFQIQLTNRPLNAEVLVPLHRIEIGNRRGI